MTERNRIKKVKDKVIAKFQGIEVVPGGPVMTDIDSMISDIRDADILEGGINFGEFQGLVLAKDGTWPALAGIPNVITEIFNRALVAEQAQNPSISGCHISVRIQGDEKARHISEDKEYLKGRGINPDGGFLHYDGIDKFSDMSEYMISFSGPTTIQYLGEARLPNKVTRKTLTTELTKVSSTNLNAVSLLPRELYHMTNRTPHSEPMTLGDYVSNEKPRLFMRFMFGKFDKTTGFSGKVYQA